MNFIFFLNAARKLIVIGKVCPMKIGSTIPTKVVLPFSKRRRRRKKKEEKEKKKKKNF